MTTVMTRGDPMFFVPRLVATGHISLEESHVPDYRRLSETPVIDSSKVFESHL